MNKDTITEFALAIGLSVITSLIGRIGRASKKRRDVDWQTYQRNTMAASPEDLKILIEGMKMQQELTRQLLEEHNKRTKSQDTV